MVPRNEELTRAVQEAIVLWPGSDNELARSAGISRHTIRRLQTGEHGVTEETAAKILHAIRKKKENLERAADWLAELLEG